MDFFRKLTIAHLALLSALFFAVLGAIDIFWDIAENSVSVFGVVVNSILFIPLIFRHRLVYRASGWLAVLFAVYGGLAILSFLVKHLNGTPMRYPFDTFVIGPLFMLAITTAGILMIRAGAVEKDKSTGGTA